MNLLKGVVKMRDKEYQIRLKCIDRKKLKVFYQYWDILVSYVETKRIIVLGMND